MEGIGAAETREDPDRTIADLDQICVEKHCPRSLSKFQAGAP
jgi:hypothetical protein